MADVRTETNALDLIASSAAAAQSRRRNVRIRNIGIGVAGFLTLLLVWKLGVIIMKVPPYILPAPEQVLVALWSGIAVSPASPLGWYLPLWSTMSNALLGFVIGASFGLLFGSLMAEFRAVETALMPYAFALQSLPKVAIAPLIVIWCGFGDGSKVAMAALLAFFPMLVNCFAGMRAAEVERLPLFAADEGLRALRALEAMASLPSSSAALFAADDFEAAAAGGVGEAPGGGGGDG